MHIRETAGLQGALHIPAGSAGVLPPSAGRAGYTAVYTGRKLEFRMFLRFLKVTALFLFSIHEDEMSLHALL